MEGDLRRAAIVRMCWHMPRRARVAVIDALDVDLDPTLDIDGNVDV
jgi:hypothetical protein